MKTAIVVFGLFLGPIVLGQSFNLEAVEGAWKGTLEMYSLATKKDSQPEVTLTIQPLIKDSVWVWRTDYISEQYGTISKDYTMRVIDHTAGTYILDEGDGILLEQQLSGNAMYSIFEVQDQILTAKYTFHQDEIEFEVCNSTKSQDTTDVLSHRVENIQRVILKRVKQ
ncbi:MAG: hypothetical protein ABNH00_08715 [Dokdonia sp.]|jgi:hypothetical protein